MIQQHTPRIGRLALTLAAIGCLSLAACSQETNNNANTPDMAAPDDQGNGDTGQEQPGDMGPDADGPDQGDGAASSCTQVTVDVAAFELAYQDDVEAEYGAPITPSVGPHEVLSLMFNRFLPPGAETGTFTLGAGIEENFGTCANCLVIRGDMAARAMFADRGQLVVRRDPYSRQLDVEVTDLRLIEVSVRAGDRYSEPVPGGDCIEVADFSAAGVFPPAEWTCAKEKYHDGQTCDCDCVAIDPDCFLTPDCLPLDPMCQEPDPLPVAGCGMDEVCAFEPETMGIACIESCDWLGRQGCTTGTCVFDFGVGDGDLCISSQERVAADVAIGGECPRNNYQVMCAVDAEGFAMGYCSPNHVCSPVCDEESDCTNPEESCRRFVGTEGLGYCGPEPTDEG